MTNEVIRNFINDYYLSSKDPRAEIPDNITVDHFCSDEHNTNLCARLVHSGAKTASSSLKASYSIDEILPQVNSLVVITDWNKNPVCIIEVTEVTECRFSEVTSDFAFAEGEGDKSLNWWQDVHWKVFSAECNDLGIDPSEDMMLILERFKVVYRSG